MKTIHAVYEQGVFKPTEPVDLPEHCPVTVEPAPEKARESIEDEIARIMADVPDEEWKKLPADLTDNLDKYLYGGNAV